MLVLLFHECQAGRDVKKSGKASARLSNFVGLASVCFVLDWFLGGLLAVSPGDVHCIYIFEVLMTIIAGIFRATKKKCNNRGTGIFWTISNFNLTR